ncbi:MAG: hypothetical protein JWQ90_973 [Hydrocarboniphaga sp.]|uniref:hypothetical protein n=1 Tax=Hydrocarboniphaga sp. TaxID=2033016 RepID=UPI00260BC486|nr:hypothetical protein [Hydrocarboniphaga sp.]MDB5968523.1 hypothetical protein [Hydrocarboniphaga sp.]
MANAAKAYLQGLNDKFSYLGTWLPNGNRRLGDVGVQKGEEWKRVTSLRDLGITFTVRPGTQTIDFTHTSHSGVKLRSKLGGELKAAGATLAEAGIAIEFSEEGSFVFQAASCRTDEIEDQVSLGEALIKLFEQGRWEREWSVIDTLVIAKSATIIVSNSKASMLELDAKTPLQLANLADASAGISVVSQSGDVTRFIAAEGLTPLFKLSRLRKSLLGSLLGAAKPITFGGPGRTDTAGRPSADNALEHVPLEL